MDIFTNALSDTAFAAIEGEIPEVDEGFDGLALYYASDILEKTSAVTPDRRIPAIYPEPDGNAASLSQLQDIYTGYPYAAHGDEFGLTWASHNGTGIE